MADLEGRLLAANPAYAEFLGYSVAEVLGHRVTEFISPDDLEHAQALMAHFLEAGLERPFEVAVRRKDGSLVYAEITAKVVTTPAGPHMEGVVRDVTERHLSEERLRYEAFHDPLTGLPNRAVMLDRLTAALACNQRARGNVAVLLLDVDRFKLVNDTYGHQAGDDLLVLLAARMQPMLRAGETLARIGGDEFVLVAESIRTHSEAVAIAQRIASAFTEPFNIAGRNLQVECSLGLAIASDAQTVPEDLLRDADTAMYRAKSLHKPFEIYGSAPRTVAAKDRNTPPQEEHGTSLGRSGERLRPSGICENADASLSQRTGLLSSASGRRLRRKRR